VAMRCLFGHGRLTAVAVVTTLVLSLAWSAPVSAGGTWGTPKRVLKGDVEGVAMAIAAGGKLHLAVTGTPGLWYATNRSGAWTASLILKSKGTRWGYTHPSIAVDEHGRVHIAFTRLCRGATCGMESSDGVFFVTDLGRAAGTFPAPTRIGPQGTGSPDLRVLSGRRYLAYDLSGLGTEPQLWLATYASGHWVRRHLPFRGASPSLRVTAGGGIRIACIDGDAQHGQTGVGYLSAPSATGTFAHRTIRSQVTDAEPPELALTSSNAPVAIWREPSGAGIMWARQVGGSWTAPAALGPDARAYALTIDAADLAHVVAGSTGLGEWILGGGSRVISATTRPWSVATRAAFGHIHAAWTDDLGVLVASR
jgi:hypothetical protein